MINVFVYPVPPGHFRSEWYKVWCKNLVAVKTDVAICRRKTFITCIWQGWYSHLIHTDCILDTKENKILASLLLYIRAGKLTLIFLLIDTDLDKLVIHSVAKQFIGYMRLHKVHNSKGRICRNQWQGTQSLYVTFPGLMYRSQRHIAEFFTKWTIYHRRSRERSKSWQWTASPKSLNSWETMQNAPWRRWMLKRTQSRPKVSTFAACFSILYVDRSYKQTKWTKFFSQTLSDLTWSYCVWLNCVSTTNECVFVN